MIQPSIFKKYVEFMVFQKLKPCDGICKALKIVINAVEDDNFNRK